MLAVAFDDRYACPICTEVLEAAVTTGGVCDHVFCRGCLEDHAQKAARPEDCVCPMCRAPLVSPATGRVEAGAAGLVRAALKLKKGRCHCGARVALSGLREHLRSCGPDARLYPPRRKFGHSFKQPPFVDPPRARASTVDLAEEERRQIQAAILASLGAS